MNDNVNHPAHYTDGNIEVIDFIEDKQLGYHLGNAVKYIARAGKKDPDKYVEDLQKAVWYLEREINRKLDDIWNDPIPSHAKYTERSSLPDGAVFLDVSKLVEEQVEAMKRNLCKRAPETNPMEEVSSEEAFFRDVYKNRETSVL